MKNRYQNIADVKIKKIVTSINIIVHDKRNKWKNNAIDNNWKKYAKQIREKDAQAQCLLISLYLSNHNILRFQNRSDEQSLKNFKKLILSQKLL